jgi:hypothetical protein
MNPFPFTKIVKEMNRGEREFRVFNKTTSSTSLIRKDFNLIILSNLSFKIF